MKHVFLKKNVDQLTERLSREVGNNPHMSRQQIGLYEAGIPRRASFRNSLKFQF